MPGARVQGDHTIGEEVNTQHESIRCGQNTVELKLHSNSFFVLRGFSHEF